MSGDRPSIFSLRRNFGILTKTPHGHLAPLDGLRAFSILWIICGHSLLTGGLPAFTLMASEDSATRTVVAVFLNAPSGVVTFFVLSGFLISRILIQEHARTGTVSLKRFYLSRALRLLPTFYLALALYLTVGPSLGLYPGNVEASWSYLVYLNNYYPASNLTQVMPHAWSLAVEEHFYWLFPLLALGLFRMRRQWPRLGVLVLLFFVGLGIRAAILIVYEDRWSTLDLDQQMALTYVPTHARFGELLVGVWCAFAVAGTQVIPWLKQRTWLPAVFAAAAITMLVALVVFSAPTALGQNKIYMTVHNSLFAVGVGFMILFVLSETPSARPLRAFMSLRIWHVLAQLTYSAYLIHVLVTTSVAQVFPPSTLPRLLVLTGLNILITFVIAVPVYLFIERPLMNLRERWAVSPKTTTGSI